jgi:hypothetical protein
MGDDKDFDAQGSSEDVPDDKTGSAEGSSDIWNQVATHQENLKTHFAREFRDRPLVIGEDRFRVEITDEGGPGERREGADRRVVVDRRAVGDRRLGLELRGQTGKALGHLWRQSKNNWMTGLFKAGGERPVDRRSGAERRSGEDRRIGFDRRS